MVLGFVLINIVPGHEFEVYNKLAKVPQIIELHPLFGEYDLIVKIEAKDFEDIGNIVTNKIKLIEGVADTETLTGKKL
jgi:DNA-binding Lrp family transcriptional regulator